ncbi:MAG TPA: ABC transporter permease [Fimbriimonadaceae bacterium]|nr:ABC transporter permease [Fimbriimonadaceae bacterium]
MSLDAVAFRPLRKGLEFLGELWILLWDAIRRLPTPPFEWRETVGQMAFIGVASLPIVTLTSFFSGSVIALYLTEFLHRYGATGFIGGTVGLTVTREMGPVLAGITVAARCGSSMASQIGSMAVTEQIDALKMLSVHPTKFLVVPRLVASVTMLPILGLASVYAASIGGYIITQQRGVAGAIFLDSYKQYTGLPDLWSGLVKTPVFGMIIALVACQQGLRTKSGAVGVGRATTNAVVIGIVLVYLADFVIASLQY